MSSKKYLDEQVTKFKDPENRIKNIDKLFSADEVQPDDVPDWIFDLEDKNIDINELKNDAPKFIYKVLKSLYKIIGEPITMSDLFNSYSGYNSDIYYCKDLDLYKFYISWEEGYHGDDDGTLDIHKYCFLYRKEKWRNMGIRKYVVQVEYQRLPVDCSNN